MTVRKLGVFPDKPVDLPQRRAEDLDLTTDTPVQPKHWLVVLLITLRCQREGDIADGLDMLGRNSISSSRPIPRGCHQGKPRAPQMEERSNSPRPAAYQRKCRQRRAGRWQKAEATFDLPSSIVAVNYIDRLLVVVAIAFFAVRHLDIPIQPVPEDARSQAKHLID
jgi:hypothetical protein